MRSTDDSFEPVVKHEDDTVDIILQSPPDRDIKQEANTSDHLLLTEDAVTRRSRVSSPSSHRIPECNIRLAITTPFARSTTQTVYNFGPVSELLKDGKTRKDIEVGRTFPDRDSARKAGIHVSAMAGICGTADIGCPSIALSGGYEDNEDKIYTFDYTGAGGKCYIDGANKSERGEDQSWQSNNLALFKSYKLGYPVRVLRGHKSKTICAPSYGYRYDGLYQIVFCWIQRSVGLGGQKVIKFAFQRLPNQPPIVCEGRKFKEDDFIKDGMTRSWIELPEHFLEVPRTTSTPREPALVDLGDGLGTMTPHEYFERERNRAGASGRSRLRLPISYSKTRHAPYTIPHTPPVVTDAFGNPLQLNSTPPPKPQAPAKPVVQKVVRREDPYAASVYRKLAVGVRDAPPYLEWLKQCEAAGKVVEIS